MIYFECWDRTTAEQARNWQQQAEPMNWGFHNLIVRVAKGKWKGSNSIADMKITICHLIAAIFSVAVS